MDWPILSGHCAALDSCYDHARAAPAPARLDAAVSGPLDVPQGAALTIGAVLGTGVISLPALAAQEAGPASLLAWAGLLVLRIPLAATFAALGARYPDGGGVSTYARRAFGARAATVVGWCFCFAIQIGAPTAAGFAGAYVADSVGGGRRTQLLATGALIELVAHELVRPAGRGRVQLVIAGVLGALLLAATLVSLPHADGQPDAVRAARLARGRHGGGPAGLGVRRLGGGHLAVR